MKILSVKIGSVDIPVKRFTSFITTSKLSEVLDMESVSDDDVKFLSKEQNIRTMEEGDTRIAKLGRSFLYTYALTRQQQGLLKDFLTRNHITVEFAEPIEQWLFATTTEREHLGGGQ